MSPVISISDVVTLNKQLAETGSDCKVHLRDACGKQTLWIEAPDATPQQLSQFQQRVRELCAQLGYEIEFDEFEGINFWVK
ncbi:MAG: RDAC family protein [Atopobiaceae bacterium]|jgi:hypothetical protein